MNLGTFRSLAPALLALWLSACGGGGDSGGGAGAAVGIGAAGQSVIGIAADAGHGSSSAGGGGSDASGAVSSGGAGAGDTTASAVGDDGSGVGSGGTGVSASAGVGIGSADGLGSVIVNGVRYNTDAAQFSIEDTSELQLGMSLKVSGSVDGNLKTGKAARVESAAELRGLASSVDTATGRFTVTGTTVSTDPETVWADSAGLGGIAAGSTVQVWGLPAAPGALRATRVARVTSALAPVVTGTVHDLNALRREFSIGTVRISYLAATFGDGLTAATVANGQLVRVRAAAWDGTSTLESTMVQPWYPVPQTQGIRVDLEGLIFDYAGLSSFRVLGTEVDATGAQITGGQSANVGNGVKVEVAGLLTNGIVRATRLKIRQIPGTGGPSSFILIGTVGSFSGPASFRVRGQPVDASGSSVVFVNGNIGALGNGAKVTVVGSQVINGSLRAATVTFD